MTKSRQIFCLKGDEDLISESRFRGIKKKLLKTLEEIHVFFIHISNL